MEKVCKASAWESVTVLALSFAPPEKNNYNNTVFTITWTNKKYGMLYYLQTSNSLRGEPDLMIMLRFANIYGLNATCE